MSHLKDRQLIQVRWIVLKCNPTDDKESPKDYQLWIPAQTMAEDRQVEFNGTHTHKISKKKTQNSSACTCNNLSLTVGITSLSFSSSRKKRWEFSKGLLGYWAFTAPLQTAQWLVPQQPGRQLRSCAMTGPFLSVLWLSLQELQS